MKNFNKMKYIGLLLCTAIGFSSCAGFLEEDNYSNVVSETFITQDNADQLVVGAYLSLRDVYRTGYNPQFLGTDIFTTRAEMFSYNALNDYYDINASISSIGDVWQNNYSLIANCNTAVNRYENEISWDESYETYKNYGVAQAKALRALGYFNLVQQFGGVPLMLTEESEIRADYSKATEEECYTQMISDLEAAIPNLEVEPEEEGRFSQRAAQYLLSEIYLTRGYTTFAGSSDFATAAALAEEAIADYDIRTQTYNEVFDFDNQVNDEILFAIQFGNGAESDDSENVKHSLFMNNVQEYVGISRSNPYGIPSTDLLAMPTEYFYGLFADNDTREAATMHRVLYADEDGTYSSSAGQFEVEAGDTVIYFPKYEMDADEIADKMNRYYVYQPDEYYFGTPSEIDGTIFRYEANPSKANFPIFKKFDDQDFAETAGGQRDIFVFRVAGAHLLAAEAYLQAGSTADALPHLNIVRERATEEANYYTEATVDNILDERAMELAGEVNRWAVLKRTGKLQERLANNPHYLDHGAFDADIHLVRPIPEHEIELSDGSLEQNPGY